MTDQDSVELLEMLGTLWSDISPDRRLHQVRCAVRLAQLRQNLQLLDAAAAAADWHTVPVGHSVYRRALRLRRRDAHVRYDGTHQFFYHDGESGADSHPLQSVDIIADRITSPNVVFCRDIDFTHRGWMIAFFNDPFKDDRLYRKPVIQDGVIVDEELTLWLYRPTVDLHLPQRFYGAAFGWQAKVTTEQYRDSLATVLDALVSGTTVAHLVRLVALAFDLPVTGRSEVVDEIIRDNHYLTIVTDRQVYHAACGATPAFGVGDLVPACTPLVEGFQFYECCGDQIPESVVGVPLLAEDLGLVGVRINFPNAQLNLEYTGDEANPVVRWPLPAPANVLQAFWRRVEENCQKRGTSLYSELCALYGPRPTTINPAQFMMTHVLKRNLLLFQIAQTAVGPRANYDHIPAMVSAITSPSKVVVTSIV